MFKIEFSISVLFNGLIKYVNNINCLLFSEKDEKAPKAKGKLQCHIEEKSHLTKFNAALSKRELKQWNKQLRHCGRELIISYLHSLSRAVYLSRYS